VEDVFAYEGFSMGVKSLLDEVALVALAKFARFEQSLEDSHFLVVLHQEALVGHQIPELCCFIEAIEVDEEQTVEEQALVDGDDGNSSQHMEE
jgi:hypothetical protein